MRSSTISDEWLLNDSPGEDRHLHVYMRFFVNGIRWWLVKNLGMHETTPLAQ